MKKKAALIFYIAIILSILCSCSAKQYSGIVECSYITSALQNQVLKGQEYAAYSATDVAFILDDSDDFSSYSVIYSTSSDDIGEIGVFHANSEDEAIELLDDLTEYLYELKDEKSSFVRNYLPDEQRKLDGAKVRRIGNYVAFTVLDDNQSDAIFAEIEKILAQ